MIDPILIDLPDEIVGERIVIRPYHAGMGVQLFEAVQESMPELGEWFPWAEKHTKVEDSEVVVRRAAARWMLREDMTVGVWRKADDWFLGGSGLHRIDWERRKFEIGYWVRKSVRRQGYATECAQLLRDFAFGELVASRVMIRCGEPNLASAAVARRAGFKQEGVLRNDAVRNGDGLCNMLVFGMTRDEWCGLSGAR